MLNTLNVRQLGLCPWEKTAAAMDQFTKTRQISTIDELWLVEHPSLFTQGRAGKAEHLLSSSNIPVLQSDRGGQITYHGPGQQIAYTLIDLKRCKMNIRKFVTTLENCVINLLAQLNIEAYARSDAPGVYVNSKKICSLGLRIKRNCTMHGLALNVNMDLQPFEYINPCGHAGLKMAQIAEFNSQISMQQVQTMLINEFINLMRYNNIGIFTDLPKQYN